jgi:8-oxo-dGTP pyrophosphatase MutT (NUDIX family)
MAARIAGIEAGLIAPRQPRDAATVMVLRSGADGVEVLMLRRPATMAFAPGAYVFPGGSVDEADADTGIAWHGPSAADIGARLGASADTARALVCAAVRETFEEAGILLAGPPGGGLAAAEDPSWEDDRAALVAGSITLAGLLAQRGLVLRADLLTPWARWITPEAEFRRFDARFFAAAIPSGQRAVGHHSEVDHVAWIRPSAALEAARAGSMNLLPPTATTLNEFLSYGAVAEIMAARRTVSPVRPRFVLEDGQAWLLIPDEAEYPL